MKILQQNPRGTFETCWISMTTICHQVSSPVHAYPKKRNTYSPQTHSLVGTLENNPTNPSLKVGCVITKSLTSL